MTGENRGYVVSCYLALDGKAVGVLLKTRAIWSDSKDGQEYYYTQLSTLEPVDFIPLTRAGTVAARVPAGPASSDPVELRVSAAD